MRQEYRTFRLLLLAGLFSMSVLATGVLIPLHPACSQTECHQPDSKHQSDHNSENNHHSDSCSICQVLIGAAGKTVIQQAFQINSPLQQTFCSLYITSTTLPTNHFDPAIPRGPPCL